MVHIPVFQAIINPHTTIDQPIKHVTKFWIFISVWNDIINPNLHDKMRKDGKNIQEKNKEIKKDHEKTNKNM